MKDIILQKGGETMSKRDLIIECLNSMTEEQLDEILTAALYLQYKEQKEQNATNEDHKED